MDGYTKIPNTMIKSDKLNLREKMIMVYLYMRAGNKNECFPSITRMASELQMSQSTVIRCIKVLEDKGLVKKIRRRNSNGGNCSNLYIITNEAYCKNEVG